jgi:DNA-binding GntR family transcriptional regulator
MQKPLQEKLMQNRGGTLDNQPRQRSTHSGDVYENLRENLIWGRWTPGEKLKPQYLKTALDCSSSVMREALIRLAGEGFVHFEEQRGFSAIVPTEQSLTELRNLRILLETEGARLSIENGALEWEAELTAAHHRLAHLEEKMRNESDISGFIKVWSHYDWAFHEAFMAACGSQHLQQMHKTVYDKFRLHVISELRDFGYRGEITIHEHNDILESALRRDLDACQQAIERHLKIYRQRQARQEKQSH